MPSNNNVSNRTSAFQRLGGTVPETTMYPERPKNITRSFPPPVRDFAPSKKAL